VNDADRFRLLFGPYRTPRFRYGDIVRCEVRGEVTICGISDGPIPWPIGKRGGARSPVVYKGLAKAVRKESGIAVCHWWSITGQTVTKWRKALGVGPVTEGTHRLKSEQGVEHVETGGLDAAWAKARDPERCRKIAESKRGKPKPRHVIEAMRKGRTGKPHDEAARAKMREAARRRRAARTR
jgi:hypothetical protein